MLEDLRQYRGSDGPQKIGGLPIYRYVNYMFIHGNFCYFCEQAWLHMKYPSKTKLLQQQRHEFVFLIP